MAAELPPHEPLRRCAARAGARPIALACAFLIVPVPAPAQTLTPTRPADRAGKTWFCRLSPQINHLPHFHCLDAASATLDANGLPPAAAFDDPAIWQVPMHTHPHPGETERVQLMLESGMCGTASGCRVIRLED
jgi:hypothetical protein